MPLRPGNPGKRLRARRLALGLSLREVEKVSLELARMLRRRAFLLPASRLHAIETKDAVPSVHRLYTLARAYGCGISELLEWYGIPRE
jgi:transcriptional regulator with XRE-family HTH domain